MCIRRGDDVGTRRKKAVGGTLNARTRESSLLSRVLFVLAAA